VYLKVEKVFSDNYNKKLNKTLKVDMEYCPPKVFQVLGVFGMFTERGLKEITYRLNSAGIEGSKTEYLHAEEEELELFKDGEI